MAVIETWYNQDLQKPVNVHYLDGSLFSHNGNGNRIGVHVFNNGEPVTLSGTISGYVVTADGSTVPCTGTRSGNDASILIPPAAYQPGAVFITLFITDGTTVTTIASVATSVLTARTNNQVDPGSVVTDWTQTINAAMQSVETAAEDLGGIVAVPYANITFPVPLGKYTYYNGGLYRCISAIASSESFTPAHWTAVRLGDDVADLKSAIENSYVNNPPVSNGSFTASGTYSTNNKRLRTNFIPVKIGDKIVIDNGSLKHACGGWNGTLSSATIIRNDNSFSTDDEVIISAVNGYYIVVFAKQDTTQTIELSDFDGSIHLYANEIYRNTNKINVNTENINAVKSAITDLDNDSSNVTGNVMHCDYERGLRYINSGVETFGNDNSRIRVKKGEYIYFNSGDSIQLIDNINYQYLGGYSTDNGTTWTYIPNTIDETIIPSDSIGFVCISKKSGTFGADDDYTGIAKSIMKIIRKNAIAYSDYLQNETWDAFTTALSSKLTAEHLIKQVYINTTAGQKFYNVRVGETQADKGDTFKIKATFSVAYPSNYSSKGIRIYEVNESGQTVTYIDISDLSNVISYSVTGNTTKKIFVLPYVTTDNGAVATPYNESFDLKIGIAKAEMADVYTESGDIWEV